MTNPLPSRCWALLCRYISEFTNDKLSGSITLRLDFDRGRMAKWKAEPSFGESVDKGAA